MTEASLAQIVLNLIISIDCLLKTDLRKGIAKEFLWILTLQKLLIHSPLAQKRDNCLLHVKTSSMLLASFHHLVVLDNLRHRGDLIVRYLLLEATIRRDHLD